MESETNQKIFLCTGFLYRKPGDDAGDTVVRIDNLHDRILVRTLRRTSQHECTGQKERRSLARQENKL